MRTQQKQRVDPFGDPWIVKQHHWNTEANGNHQLNPGEPRNRHKHNSDLDHLMNSFSVGVIIESKPRPIGDN